jgi:long-chain fatty acid transport protein
MSLLRLSVLFVCIWFVAISHAFAGSGAFRVELPDAGALGKGSAFVGEANTPAAVYYNPAGINQIKDIQISSGFAIVAPRETYRDTAGQTTQMRNNEFLVPHMYVIAPINERIALGFGSGSFWGLGTEWATDSFSRYVATKTELINTDTMFTASYQITEQLSFAASADNDYSKADENKNLNNFISSDGHISLKAKDDAWGYRLATLFKINNQNQIGLMYRSAIHHRYIGKVYIDGINGAVYGPGGIAGLPGAAFGSSSYETRATEKVVLPQSIVMGYSFKPIPKWTFNFDLEWMNWSRYKQDLINYPDENDAGRSAFLNTGNPTPRNWHSAFSEAIGAEYGVSERLRLRAGYYHHAHVIPQGTFQSSLPDSNSHGISAGCGFDLTHHLTLDLAYSGLIYEQRKVNNDVGASLGANISGQYRQYTHLGLVTITYKF